MKSIDLISSQLRSDGIRFVIGGVINTLLTFLLFELLVLAFSPMLSYTIAWVAGLAFVVAFYPSRVFRGGRTDGFARIRLGLLYITVFLIGLVSLRAFQSINIAPRLAIILVMALTSLINFVLGRFLLRTKYADGDHYGQDPASDDRRCS